MKTFGETCAMFKKMKSLNRFTKDKHPLKIPMPDANRDSNARKRKGGEAALPINPKKGHAGKRRTKNTVSPSEKTTGADKTCLLHGPVNSSEECKVLKYHSKKYAAQRPHKDTEARYGGKTKCSKTAKFNSSVK